MASAPPRPRKYDDGEGFTLWPTPPNLFPELLHYDVRTVADATACDSCTNCVTDLKGEACQCLNGYGGAGCACAHAVDCSGHGLCADAGGSQRAQLLLNLHR